MAAIELVLTTTSFWKFTGQAYQESLAKNADSAKGSLRDAVLRMPAARVSWLCAFFLLGYVGVEVSLGGWIVEFMIQVRKGEPFASGMAATGFWLGIAVGRLVLGFVTPKIGENRAIIVSPPPPLLYPLVMPWAVFRPPPFFFPPNTDQTSSTYS